MAIDLSSEGTRCVKMRGNPDSIQIIAADTLPPVNLSEDSKAPNSELNIPKNLIAKYVAIAIPSETAVIKLLNLPKQIDEDNADALLRENLGLEEGDYRIGHVQVGKGHSRTETKVVAAAVDNSLARIACELFPVGIPAPASVEVSGLASLTAFAYRAAKSISDKAVGVIDFRANTTFLAFFLNSEPILIRKFDFGTRAIMDKVGTDLGVDEETARNILADESFDISQSIKAISDPFVKQITISRHFVERREDTSLAAFFVAEEPLVSRIWFKELRAELGLDVTPWDPFMSLEMAPNALSEEQETKKATYAAAIGAGIGLIKGST